MGRGCVRRSAESSKGESSARHPPFQRTRGNRARAFRSQASEPPACDWTEPGNKISDLDDPADAHLLKTPLWYYGVISAILGSLAWYVVA